MNIETQDFRAWFEPSTSTVYLSGVMRLAGPDAYAPVSELLNQASEVGSSITLDVRDLKLLNSSGIHMLSKFMLRQRKRDDLEIMVRGSSTIEWQNKTLITLQRLLPSLVLNLD